MFHGMLLVFEPERTNAVCLEALDEALHLCVVVRIAAPIRKEKRGRR